MYSVPGSLEEWPNHVQHTKFPSQQDRRLAEAALFIGPSGSLVPGFIVIREARSRKNVDKSELREFEECPNATLEVFSFCLGRKGTSEHHQYLEGSAGTQ